MTDFADALGARLGFLETYAAAAVLERDGHAVEGQALVDAMFAQVSPQVASLIRDEDRKYHLDPFTSAPGD